MSTSKLTKTSGTCAFYKRVAVRLEGHAKQMQMRGDLGNLADVNLRMAMAYRDLEPTVQSSTAKIYRLAALNAIALKPGPFDSEAMSILDPEMSPEEAERLHHLSEVRSSTLTVARGAQQKAKHLAPEDWNTLLKALLVSKSQGGPLASTWLTATLTTGLRPCEWKEAKLVGSELVVKNAKNTNGRGHGPFRTINLRQVPQEVRAVIQDLLDEISSASAIDFSKKYTDTRKAIWSTTRRIFEGRKTFPTIYTARDCFAARAKATFPKDYVAALMGHASIFTAARHYAPARHAKGQMPLDVEPSFKDVDAVRRASAAKGFLLSRDREP